MAFASDRTAVLRAGKPIAGLVTFVFDWGNSGLGATTSSHRLDAVCGLFPWDSVVEVYQQSPVFRALRDTDRLRGKCGICEYCQICGGSRARSYGLTGDPLASEPDCAYQPGTA